MNSHWHSVSDFIHMGGYGLYVWGSVGGVALFIAGELIGLAWRRRAILRQLSEAP